MTRCQLDIVVENEDSEIVGKSALSSHLIGGDKPWLAQAPRGRQEGDRDLKLSCIIWLFCVSSIKYEHSVTRVEIYRYQKYNNNKELTGPKLELGVNCS